MFHYLFSNHVFPPPNLWILEYFTPLFYRRHKLWAFLPQFYQTTLTDKQNFSRHLQLDFSVQNNQIRVVERKGLWSQIFSILGYTFASLPWSPHGSCSSQLPLTDQLRVGSNMDIWHPVIPNQCPFSLSGLTNGPNSVATHKVLK